MKRVVQTPKNEHGRSSGLVIRRSKETPWNPKFPSDQAKKPHRIPNKSLDSAFSSLSHDDDDDDSDKQPLLLPPVSEVPSAGAANHHQFDISTEVINPELNPSLSASSETFAAVSGLASQSSEIATATADEAGDSSTTRSRPECIHQPDSSKLVSLEAEMVVSHLLQARSEVLNSSGASLRSKRLLEAMTNVMIEEICPLPEERDHWIADLLVVFRARIALLFLAALCVLSVFSVAFLLWPFDDLHPPPT